MNHVRELAEKIAKQLFHNGMNEKASRLKMIGAQPDEDLGGWCLGAVVDRVETVLRLNSQTPKNKPKKNVAGNGSGKGWGVLYLKNGLIHASSIRSTRRSCIEEYAKFFKGGKAQVRKHVRCRAIKFVKVKISAV